MKWLFPVLALMLLVCIPTSYAWWNQSWLDCTQVAISRTDKIPANFTYTLTLNSSNINYINVNSDLSDIRIVNGSTCNVTDSIIFNYTITSINASGNSTVDFLSPFENLSSILIYYNNNVATTASNVNGTYLFFINSSNFNCTMFEDGGVPTGGVQGTGICVEQPNYLSLRKTSANDAYAWRPNLTLYPQANTSDGVQINITYNYTKDSSNSQVWVVLKGKPSVQLGGPALGHYSNTAILSTVNDAGDIYGGNWAQAAIQGPSVTVILRHNFTSVLYNWTNASTSYQYIGENFSIENSSLSAPALKLSYYSEITALGEIGVFSTKIIKYTNATITYAYNATVVIPNILINVTIQSPANKTYINNNVSLNVTITVVGAAIDKIWYVLNSDTKLCFQESSNVSTSCGGLSNGTYDVQGGAFNINYTKMIGATSAIWQVKHGLFATYNVTIDSTNCWNAYTDKLRLQFLSTVGRDGASCGAYSYGQCYNGTGWQTITTVSCATNLGATQTSISTDVLTDGDWNTGAGYDTISEVWENKTSYADSRAMVYEEAIIWNTTEYLTSNTTINATQGFNSLVIYANTTTGITNVSAVNFTYTVLYANVSMITPTNTTYNSTNITLNYVLFIVNDTIDSCWYTLNADTNVSLLFCQNTTLIANASRWNNVTLYFNVSLGVYNSTTTFFSLIAPTVTSVNITPKPAIFSNNLSILYACTGLTGLICNASVEYTWFRNNVNLNINAANLSTGNFTTGDNITASVRVNDTIEFSNWVNSTILTIGDTTAPIITYFNISDTSTTTVGLLTTYINCTDDNSIGYVYAEIIDPLLAVVNYTMNFLGNTSYSYPYAPGAVGTYFVKGWCVDGSNNAINTTTKVFTVSLYVPPAGGGSSGGVFQIIQAPICGNLICEVGETQVNCQKDCANLTFFVMPELFFQSGDSGTEVTCLGEIKGCTFAIQNPTAINQTFEISFVEVQTLGAARDLSYQWAFLLDDRGNKLNKVTVLISGGNAFSPGVKRQTVIVDIPDIAAKGEYAFKIEVKNTRTNEVKIISYRLRVGAFDFMKFLFTPFIALGGRASFINIIFWPLWIVGIIVVSMFYYINKSLLRGAKKR